MNERKALVEEMQRMDSTFIDVGKEIQSLKILSEACRNTSIAEKLVKMWKKTYEWLTVSTYPMAPSIYCAHICISIYYCYCCY